MANMPSHLENSELALIWKEVERIGISQGVDPTQSEVIMQGATPRALESLQKLQRVGGAQLTNRDNDPDSIAVRLAYEGEGSVPLQSGGAVATSKPSTVARNC